MNKKEPLVSIVMPTYNRPLTLERAIDSCLNQTYLNIEIVIVDDNNPDSEARVETQNIIKKYDNNPKVKYIQLERNSGACVARNKGIEIANGEYITFLDDDDEFFEDNIEKEIKYMLEHDYDMIFCDLRVVEDSTGKEIVLKYRKNFELTKEGLLKKHLLDIISGGIAFMYKKQVLINIGGFYNIPASQEYILMLNTILGDYKIGYFEFIGALGHRHGGATRITGSKKAIEAKKQVIKLVKPHLHYLSLKDRRKVLFRLNLFIALQYWRHKDINFLIYGFKLMPYLDLLILKVFKKDKDKNKKEDIIYF